MKKIIIAGGTGFIGQQLASHFDANGYEVIILTRGQTHHKGYIQYVQWDACTMGSWCNYLEGAETIINLVGKSVDCRYTEANKKEILRSRVEATQVIGKALEGLKAPPKLWINSSTATIYEHSLEHPNDEETGKIGHDFSMHVAKSWENAFYETTTPKTRKVALRISLVLGINGGVLPVLIRNARLGLGGHQGNGLQKFAWVHVDDVKRIIDFIIDNDSLEGPINCTANEVITNSDFNTALRQALNVRFGLNSPTPLLKLGCFLLRTEAELILKSRYVIPKKLNDHGFQFQYPDINTALAHLTQK